jgi:hypothetical protein
MTAKKALKSTLENCAQMARHGAPPETGYLTPLENDLKGSRACCFLKNSPGQSIIGHFRGFPQKISKMWIKPVLRGLKVVFKANFQKQKKSVTFHPAFSEKGGF